MCLVQQRKVLRYLMNSSVTPLFLGDPGLGKSGHGQHSMPMDKSTYFLVQECKKSLVINLAPSEGGSFGVYVRLSLNRRDVAESKQNEDCGRIPGLSHSEDRFALGTAVVFQTNLSDMGVRREHPQQLSLLCWSNKCLSQHRDLRPQKT